MKEWFNSLEARERKVLIGGAIVLAMTIFYFLLWDPLVSKMQRLELSTQEQQELIIWMETAASEVVELRQKVATVVSSGSKGQSLLGIIDVTAKKNRLKEAVKRVQPDGQNKASVRLEKAKFDDVIRWIEQLKRSEGIRVESTVIERQEENGVVNARFVFVGSV